MVTLRNLYQSFSHDPEWSQMAARCLQPMMAIYLRKLGDRDILLITDIDLQTQLEASMQPVDVKAKAQSCMHHLRNWAKNKGKPFATPEPETVLHPKRGEHQRKRRKADIEMTAEEWEEDTRRRYGTIEHETQSKGWKNGKRVMCDRWRAVIQINGKRYRHRAHSREECEEWLKAVCEKRILPTDNKADWMRMEQKKDESERIDEIIVSQAEESAMLYDYHQKGNIEDINDYLTDRLLPHMMYYAAHTLHLSKDAAITASKQAAALLLTRITAGRPILNFTSTCKRMLRVYKQRGNFFYYESAPEQVKLMVNKINFDELAKVWKVTKDRRI